jgi:hypothetical protein
MSIINLKIIVKSTTVALCIGLILAGCAPAPLHPFNTETTPLMLVPAIQTEAQDRRGRFREIFCAVMDARKETLPDYRRCDEALTTVGEEPPGTGKPVNLGMAHRRLKIVFVPRLGWDCIADWLEKQDSISSHLQRFGYDMVTLDIDGLSSSAHNAQLIRNAILTLPEEETRPDLVLVGYSKGAADVLSAIVNYPEIRRRIVAVVTVAGAVGGSPLANDASDKLLNLMQYFPGSSCQPTGAKALEDLRPETRKAWLARHPLPLHIAYYSMITFPEPDQISELLESSYRKLSQVDARNDSQLIFYDQFVPGSTLVAYLNADHWGIGVPIARTHPIFGTYLVDNNSFPREAMYESLMRLIEEDLQLKDTAFPQTP